MNRVVLYEQIWIYWLITTLGRFPTRACFWPGTSWGWRMLWSTMQLWWIPGKQQGCSVPNLSGRCLVAPEWICSNCSTSDMRRLRSSCYVTHSRESYMWRNVKRGNDLWSVAYDNVLDEMHLLAVTLVSQWAIDSFRCDTIVSPSFASLLQCYQCYFAISFCQKLWWQTCIPAVWGKHHTSFLKEKKTIIILKISFLDQHNFWWPCDLSQKKSEKVGACKPKYCGAS